MTYSSLISTVDISGGLGPTDSPDQLMWAAWMYYISPYLDGRPTPSAQLGVQAPSMVINIQG